MAVREYKIRNFKSGLQTRLEDFSIERDAASKSLNWLTLGDRIELSGGYDVIGTENGAGKITGLGIGERVDGSKLAIRTRGQKIEYYDTATSDWVEIGTNKLGSDADGEDVAITFYTSLAGYQAWISSPNSGLFKYLLANPDTIVDNYDSAKNFKGYVMAHDGRLLLWNRAKKKNYLYGSYKDVQDSNVYTTVSGEAVGSGGTTYSGTLSAISGKRTCFNVVFTDSGGQTLTDDKNGGFTGDGTGTINYSTGAYSVTFSSTTGTVTVDYDWENSTAKGLADFTFSSTRLATEGFFLPQPTGGDLQSIASYRTDLYCLHRFNAWLFTMPVDDLNPTNQVFRENLGMENWRAAVATGDGIYYIDTSNPSDPQFKLLSLSQQNDQVEPRSFSFDVDLSGYDFSDGIGYRWGDYILFACKVLGDSVNNRLFAFNTIWKSFDVLSYNCSVLADNNGDLWAGEPSTDNVTQLFTGFTANGSLIENYWEGQLSEHDIAGLKKFKRLTVSGNIGTDQSCKVQISYDNGSWETLGTIDGTGSYVSSSGSTSVGVSMVGSKEVGGGGDGVDAKWYVREFRVRSGKYERAKIRFEATGVGYLSVSEIEFYDLKSYGQKNLKRYRTT